MDLLGMHWLCNTSINGVITRCHRSVRIAVLHRRNHHSLTHIQVRHVGSPALTSINSTSLHFTRFTTRSLKRNPSFHANGALGKEIKNFSPSSEDDLPTALQNFTCSKISYILPCCRSCHYLPSLSKKRKACLSSSRSLFGSSSTMNRAPSVAKAWKSSSPVPMQNVKAHCQTFYSISIL